MARGRGKVKVAFIHNESDRRTCYKTRKNGLIKRVSELSVLCGVEMCAIIYSPFQNEPETFPTSRDDVLKVIQRFEEVSSPVQSKRMLNPEEFTRRETDKLEGRVKKVQRNNRLNEMARVVNRRLVYGEWNRDLDLVDLEDINSVLTYKISDIKEAMQKLEKQIVVYHPGQVQDKGKGIAVGPAGPAPAPLQVASVSTAHDKGKGIMVAPGPALASATLQTASVSANQQMQNLSSTLALTPTPFQGAPVLTAQDRGKGIMVAPAPALPPFPFQMASVSADQQMQNLSSTLALIPTPLEGAPVLNAQDKGKGVMVSPAQAPFQMAPVSAHQQMQYLTSASALTPAPLQMAPVSAHHQQMQYLTSDSALTPAPLQMAPVSAHQQMQYLTSDSALTPAPLQMVAPVSADHQQMQNLPSSPFQVSLSAYQEPENLSWTPYEQTELGSFGWETDVRTPSMFSNEAGPSLINFWEKF